MKKPATTLAATVRNLAGNRRIILPAAEAKAGSAVDICHNLMLADSAPGVELRVMRCLSPLPSTMVHPVCSGYIDDGFASFPDLCTLHFPSAQRADGYHPIAVTHHNSAVMTGWIEHKPLCAMTVADGFIIMTEGGQLTLRCRDGEWTHSAISAVSGGVRLRAVSDGELSATTGAYSFADISINRSNPGIGAADNRRLASALCDAYYSMAATAASAGRWIAPVITRYHLLSASGERLYSSAPQVMHCGGWPCTGNISADITVGSDDTSISGLTVRAEAFHIEMSVPVELHPSVAAIEVTVTPQLHPVDRQAAMPVRITRSSSGAVLSVALPGATDHFSPRSGAFAGQLGEMAMRLGALERRVACRPVDVVHGPMAATVVNAPATTSATGEQAMIERAISKAVETVTADSDRALLRDISSPHSFTARRVAVCGSVVAWADISPILSAGYAVGDITADFVDKPWNGSLRITFAGGAQVAAPVGAPVEMPRRFAPLVSFPHPDAVKIELWLRSADGSECRRGEVSLTPAPDGLSARYLNRSLEGGELTAVADYQAVTPTAMVSRISGAVAVADIGSPLSVTAAAVCSAAPVMALTPAVRSGSSWDFARSHLYLFSREGICSLAVDASRRRIASALITSAGVDRPEAVAPTPEGVMALSAGKLIKVSGSRADTLLTGLRAVQAAWCAAEERLWLLDPQGNVDRLHLRRMSQARMLAPIAPDRLVQESDRLWIVEQDSIYVLADETADSSPVRWRVMADMPPGRRVRALCLMMEASAFEGKVTVTDGCRPLLCADISGTVSEPLILRLWAPPRPRLSVEIEGRASAGFVLRDSYFIVE